MTRHFWIFTYVYAFTDVSVLQTCPFYRRVRFTDVSVLNVVLWGKHDIPLRECQNVRSKYVVLWGKHDIPLLECQNARSKCGFVRKT